MGLYSLADANLIMEHALSTYFRHYNLYQYAFTTRHFLDIELSGRIWECAPPIRPLSEASTEVEWNAILEEKERLAQEERERIAAEEEAALEIARRDALIAEYEAQVPETVRTTYPSRNGGSLALLSPSGATLCRFPSSSRPL